MQSTTSESIIYILDPTCNFYIDNWDQCKSTANMPPPKKNPKFVPPRRPAKPKSTHNARRGHGTDMADDEGSSSGQQLSGLLLAASEGNTSAALQAITNGTYVEFRDSRGRTALHLASQGGFSELARRLILDGKADVNARDNLQSRPLHYAALNGHHEVARVLWQNGADVNAVNSSKETPLHLAAKRDHVAVAQFLVNEARANPLPTDLTQKTPLHVAATRSEGVINLLGTREGLAMRDKEGLTPLHDAVVSGTTKTVRVLLQKRPNLHVTDNAGNTPLHLAVKHPYAAAEHVELLRLAGADIRAVDGAGRSILYTAAMDGKAEVVKLLLGHGVPVNSQDKEGWTPLMLACNGYVVPSIRNKDFVFKAVEELMRAKPDLNVFQEDWGTPLQLAAARGHRKVVLLLIQKGARVNVDPSPRGTPLQSAAIRGQILIVRELLKAGANINACTGDWYGSALNAAAYKGRERVVHWLVDKGASIKTPEPKGICELPDAIEAAKAGGLKKKTARTVAKWLQDWQANNAKIAFESKTWPNGMTARGHSFDSSDPASNTEQEGQSDTDHAKILFDNLRFM